MMMPPTKNPRDRDLLVFALLLPVFFAFVGAQRWRSGSTDAAKVVWATGLLVSLVSLASAAARRRLYLGWMWAARPIAWIVSHVALAVMYFLVLTPLALVLRALGRDPLERGFDKGANTYWRARGSSRDTARYFRQF